MRRRGNRYFTAMMGNDGKVTVWMFPKQDDAYQKMQRLKASTAKKLAYGPIDKELREWSDTVIIEHLTHVMKAHWG